MKQTTKCNYEPVQIILYITDDLEERDRQEFEQHLSTCASCNSQYQSLRNERVNFPEKYPFHSIKLDPNLFQNRELVDDKIRKSQIQNHKPSQRRQIPVFDLSGVEKIVNIFRTTFLSSRTMYAVAASLIIIVTGSVYFRSLNVIQSKGKPFLTLYTKEAGNTFSEGNNALLYPGNSIQFTYTCMNDSYFSLFSINEHGELSKLYPMEGDYAVYLQKNSNTPIPLSFKLDNYIGNEFYIGIFSKKNYLTATIKDMLAQEYEMSGSLENMKFDDTDEYTFSTVRIKKVQGSVN